MAITIIKEKAIVYEVLITDTLRINIINKGFFDNLNEAYAFIKTSKQKISVHINYRIIKHIKDLEIQENLNIENE